LWRKLPSAEQTVGLVRGTSLSIPPRCAFQFRNLADAPLRILIVTMPPWPGPEEAEPVAGIWT
jgi:mannose-6-phosphate isomerase-like protein (cupin superfamily)